MNAYRKSSGQQQEQQAAVHLDLEEEEEEEEEEAAYDSGSQADDEQEAEDQEDSQQRPSAAAAAGDRAAARGKAAAEAAAAAGAARGSKAAMAASTSPGKQRQIVLSAADEQLIQQPFIPRASQGLPEHAIISEALAPNRAYQQQVMSSSPTRYQQQDECLDEGNQHGATGADADCYHSADGYQATGAARSSSGGASSPFKTTIAKPFEFEAAAAVRPKSIAAVKLEQDLVLKAQEEEAHYKQRWASSFNVLWLCLCTHLYQMCVACSAACTSKGCLSDLQLRNATFELPILLVRCVQPCALLLATGLWPAPSLLPRWSRATSTSSLIRQPSAQQAGHGECPHTPRLYS